MLRGRAQHDRGQGWVVAVADAREQVVHNLRRKAEVSSRGRDKRGEKGAPGS